ncbi:AMP-binding enzyme, partial [Staphylococcus succinus]
GEVTCLYYISNEIISKTELLQHFKDNIAKYKIPKRFERVSTLPYTSTGKLQRSRMK